MIQTKVVWEEYQYEMTENLKEILDEFIHKDKTLPGDGLREHDSDGNLVVIRSWTDRTSAEEWINFVLGLSPISAEILDEQS